MFPGQQTIHPKIKFLIPARGRASLVRCFAFLFLGIFLVSRIWAVLPAENGPGNKSTLVVRSSHDLQASELSVHPVDSEDKPAAKLADVLEAEELTEGSDTDPESPDSDHYFAIQFKSREIVQVNRERSAVFSIDFSLQSRATTSLVLLHHAWKSFLS